MGKRPFGLALGVVILLGAASCAGSSRDQPLPPQASPILEAWASHPAPSTRPEFRREEAVMRRAALGSEPGAAALNSRLRDLALKTEELGLRVWITQSVFIADSLGITNVEESVSWLLKMGDEKLIPAAMIRHAPAAVQIDLIPHVESRLREEGSEADEVYWVLTAGHAEAVAMVQRLEREGLLTGCAAEIARNQVYFEDMCYW